MIRTVLISLFVTLAFTEVNYAQIDYSEEIQPIFTNNCVACHGGLNGVTLRSYTDVMNSVGTQYGTNVVSPGEPDESPIIDKISSANPQYGVRMPQGGPYLSDDEIDAIVQWIQEGAEESVGTSSDHITDLANEFQLIGNYPNPFNPSTVIQFESPVHSDYRLTIYTIEGKQIYQKAGTVQAGLNDLSINLDRQTSGIYLYQISFSGNGNENISRILSGQMTLVK